MAGVAASASAGAAAGGTIGSAVPVIGTAIGTVVGAVIGAASSVLSGGEAHGPGSASRSKNLAAFQKTILALPVEERESRYQNFLRVHGNCAAASDPASCQQQASLFESLLTAPEPGSVNVPESVPTPEEPLTPEVVVDLPVGLQAPLYSTPSIVSEDVAPESQQNLLLPLLLLGLVVWGSNGV